MTKWADHRLRRSPSAHPLYASPTQSPTLTEPIVPAQHAARV